MTSRIVILAPVHIWDDVRVFKKEAASLAAEGYDVYLIARSAGRRVESGVNIIPAWTTGANRLLRFIILPFLLLQVLSYRAKVYHLHNPDTLPIALMLKLLGRKVIYDTHEDFSKRILARQWIPVFMRSFLAGVISSFEKFVSILADHTIVTQQEVAARLGKRTTVLGNPPIIDHSLEDKVNEYCRSIAVAKLDLRLVYIGGVGKNRGIQSVITALELINEKISCRLWLIGPCKGAFLAELKTMPGFRFVDYLPRMAQEKAFGYVQKADIGLIYIDDVGDHNQTDPNKLYEYMAFRTPFLASNFPKWIEKVGSSQGGVFIKPGDSGLFASTVLDLHASGQKRLSDMGQSGYSFVRAHSWSSEFKKLSSIYSSLVGTAP